MKKKNFGVILFFVLTKSVVAQPPINDVVSMFPRGNVNQKNVLIYQSLTDAQKRFLDHDTSQDVTGVITVEVTDTYLDEINNLEGLGTKSPNLNTSKIQIDDLFLLDKRSEGKFRDEFLFSTTDNSKALASRWNFKRDGGSIVVVDKFLNSKIMNINGTLSYLTAPQSPKAAWKFSGSDESTLYDITVIEPLSNGISARSINLAEKKISLLLQFLLRDKTE